MTTSQQNRGRDTGDDVEVGEEVVRAERVMVVIVRAEADASVYSFRQTLGHKAPQTRVSTRG